jgi:hypothetical protein
MNASRSIVRCGVVVRYCCQTWTAISETEEFAESVLGPEESVVVVDANAEVDGEGAEGVLAARFGAIFVSPFLTGCVIACVLDVLGCLNRKIKRQ